MKSILVVDQREKMQATQDVCFGYVFLFVCFLSKGSCFGSLAFYMVMKPLGSRRELCHWGTPRGFWVVLTKRGCWKRMSRSLRLAMSFPPLCIPAMMSFVLTPQQSWHHAIQLSASKTVNKNKPIFCIESSHWYFVTVTESLLHYDIQSFFLRRMKN